MICIIAGMMELADVPDSKSGGSDTVRVRPPLPAPLFKSSQTLDTNGFASFFILRACMYRPFHHRKSLFPRKSGRSAAVLFE